MIGYLTRTRGALVRLGRNRAGAAAVIVAITLPATLVAVGMAADTAYLQVSLSQLQSVADAAAAAGRNRLIANTSGSQQAPIDEAVRIAGANDLPTSVASADVVQGWWHIEDTSTDPNHDKFGPPIAGQTGLPFSNAIRVTARQDHQFFFGQLLGLTHKAVARQATGYKCSNLDYPLTLIQNDVPAPTLPAIYQSWATPGHPANTSYYYQQPNGQKNPIYKFYSPYDGQDVSFVLTYYLPTDTDHNNPQQLQVDTYCAGTYLVAPASSDIANFVDKNNNPVTIDATVQRGSTNNSFDVYHNQTPYPFAPGGVSSYYTANAIPTPQFDPTKQTLTTPYPSSYGIQYWASQGTPTPDRRALLVR